MTKAMCISKFKSGKASSSRVETTHTRPMQKTNSKIDGLLFNSVAPIDESSLGRAPLKTPSDLPKSFDCEESLLHT